MGLGRRGLVHPQRHRRHAPHYYHYDRLLQGLAGTGPYGYYRIGATAAQNDPGDLRLDRARPFVDHACRKTRSSTRKPRATSTSSTAGKLALAVGYEFRREELSNPGIPGRTRATW